MRKSLAIPGLVLAALTAGEAVARFGLGLGTPPLYEADAELEYRMVPNQTVHRFGNLIETNERGMRSPTLKGDGREIVLVLGDSVPNGGSQTDQSQLATSMLDDDRHLFANMSAGSWGPANELAALESNLDLAPAAIVVILNSEDLADVPSFAPLDAAHPAQTPAFALLEAVQTYLPRYLLFLKGQATAPQPPSPEDYADGRAALEALLSRLDALPVPHCIVLHPTRAEVGGEPSADSREILARIQAHGIAVVDERDLLQAAGGALYRDPIHPNAEGQKLLARAIGSCLSAAGFTSLTPTP